MAYITDLLDDEGPKAEHDDSDYRLAASAQYGCMAEAIGEGCVEFDDYGSVTPDDGGAWVDVRVWVSDETVAAWKRGE